MYRTPLLEFTENVNLVRMEPQLNEFVKKVFTKRAWLGFVGLDLKDNKVGIYTVAKFYDRPRDYLIPLIEAYVQGFNDASKNAPDDNHADTTVSVDQPLQEAKQVAQDYLGGDGTGETKIDGHIGLFLKREMGLANEPG